MTASSAVFPVSSSRVFEYVVKREEKGKICFGSGLERKTLESDKWGLTSKHARTYMRQELPVAPGMYEIPSTINVLIKKPTSNLGTVLGGRTARRGSITCSITPAPGAYDIVHAEPPKQCFAPFNTSSQRKEAVISTSPGAGVYKVSTYKHRTPAFLHSFGGKKCIEPNVKIKCGPYNFDECKRCLKSPEGDYWYLNTARVALQSNSKVKKQKVGQLSEGIFLCRECYDKENKDNSLFTKIQMQNFKKIRDCCTIHFHGGCKAKLFLVSPQEIAKLKEREAYLSLYFK